MQLVKDCLLVDTASLLNTMNSTRFCGNHSEEEREIGEQIHVLHAATIQIPSSARHPYNSAER
jgi:hypothetical protein